MSGDRAPTRPGPRRPDGAPAGPDEVRQAVLRAAAKLFAERGVDAVSLRDIATAAGVELSLITRYVGRRDTLVDAVFRDVSDRLAREVEAHPLAGQGHDLDSAMGRWVRLAASLIISGHGLPSSRDFNPVLAMAETLMDGYGQEELAARVRAAQIVAAGLGWRIFEGYLIEAGCLEEVPVSDLREELIHSARRLGATEWPSPPDPPVRGDLRHL